MKSASVSVILLIALISVVPKAYAGLSGPSPIPNPPQLLHLYFCYSSVQGPG